MNLLYGIGLGWPRRIAANLERARAAGVLAPDEVPNLWQIQLGVFRMWHRVLFRPETIGTSSDFAVRNTFRARLLEWRPLRFPFLMRRKAVAPWDFSGLVSSAERIHSHLLSAHHDGVQFVYDFELLDAHPGELESVLADAEAVVAGEHPEGEWLRDLVVYEGYHENLVAAARAYLGGDFDVPDEQQDDPDIRFVAYAKWCARQPATPAETLAAVRDGRYHPAHGVAP